MKKGCTRIRESVRRRAAMTDGFEQFETDRAQEFSDETLRAYLIGELGEQEGLLLDQRLLTDDDLAKRVRLAESQLIDDYASGDLKSHIEKVFHSRFLKTEARREQLRLTAALRGLSAQTAALSSPKQSTARSWRKALGEFFPRRFGAAWATAGAFALLVLVIGGAWYLSRQSRQSEAPIAGQLPVNAASPAVTQTPAVAQISPSAPPTPPVTQTPVEPPIAIASFVLFPGALRGPGEMARVAVPRGDRAILRLSLVLENPGPGTYHAEIANADGKTVAVKKDLRAQRNGQMKIILEVSARLIQPEDYQIKLARYTDGSLEPVGRYYFRALQE